MSGIFGGKTKSQAAQTPAYSGVQLQNSSYGRVVPLIYGTARVAPNVLWYGNFRAIAHQQKTGKGGGGGGKSGGGNVSYTYYTAVAMAICEGEIVDIPTVYVDKEVTTLAALGYSLFDGGPGQAPWPWLTGYAPTEALAYKGLGYVAASSLYLGTSPTLGNHNFVVQGVFSNSISGKVDADPSLVVGDILTNALYGAGFPSARVGSLATYQAYTVASGLWISPAYTESSTAADMLEEIAKYTNSQFVWSEGVLKAVPYGDTTITANGYTYTPPTTPLFDLTDEDYVSLNGEDPVRMVRSRPSDAQNQVLLEYLDRTNNYNASVAEAKDTNAIDLYGLITEGNQQAHLFADAAAANTSATLLLQRQAIRNTYTFTTDMRYVVLDPMDIITITDSGLGLNRQWVRVVEMSQNSDGTIDFTVEEYLAGTGTAASYTYQQGQGYNTNYNAPPGDVNPPIIFEAPVQLAETTLETWLGLSGANGVWGGCDIYMSTDGNTYTLVGQQQGKSRMGVLTAALPAAAINPDSVNVLKVDLSESSGSLLSGTTNDADLFVTLCYVGGELLAYRDATLTGPNAYDVTYLNRGGYGTKNEAHAIGADFLRLDGGIFRYTYDKDLIGQTIYLKFCSFNIYGGGLQPLSEVVAYPHTIIGPPVPSDVTGFSVQQNGLAVTMRWNKVYDYALKGYDIGYAPQGTTAWDLFLPLSEVGAGTEMTNANVPPGTWTFGIRARDVADQLSVNPTFFDLVVTNQNDVIEDYQLAPRWQGTLTDVVKHDYNGSLVLKSNSLATGNNFDVFNNFLQDAATVGYFEPSEVNLEFDATDLRIYNEQSGYPGVGSTVAPVYTFQIDYRLGAGSYSGFKDWVQGYINAQFIKFRALMYASNPPMVLTGFKPIIDASLRTVTGTVTVPVGGIHVSYGSEFHFVPNVQITASGSAVLIPVRDLTDTEGFYVQLYNEAGVDVGGVADWQARGV